MKKTCVFQYSTFVENSKILSPKLAWIQRSDQSLTEQTLDSIYLGGGDWHCCFLDEHGIDFWRYKVYFEVIRSSHIDPEGIFRVRLPTPKFIVLNIYLQDSVEEYHPIVCVFCKPKLSFDTLLYTHVVLDASTVKWTAHDPYLVLSSCD